jgi:hypothetical protein
MSWDRYFSRVRTWLPEPRVLHPYPDARFRASGGAQSARHLLPMQAA